MATTSSSNQDQNPGSGADGSAPSSGSVAEVLDQVGTAVGVGWDLFVQRG